MNATDRPQRWIGTSEFRARYGVSRPTIYRWIQQKRIVAVRVPPVPRGRVYILDPDWFTFDPDPSADLVESLDTLRQCDVAALLGITTRALRYKEANGKARFRLVWGRKRYALCEVRRLLAQRQHGRQEVTRNERRLALLAWASRRLLRHDPRH
jgi:hypothetical protein